MRRASTLWLSAVLPLLLAAPAQARDVRVFAMQPKLDPAWMETRQTYHDSSFGSARSLW